jgi:allantoicase
MNEKFCLYFENPEGVRRGRCYGHSAEQLMIEINRMVDYASIPKGDSVVIVHNKDGREYSINGFAKKFCGY